MLACEEIMRIYECVALAAAMAVLNGTFGSDAYAASKPIIVRAISVSPNNISQVTYLTGEVRARVQSELSFRVNGRIVARLVEVGDFVKAGDLLARLDAEEQEAEIAVAAANLLAAQARQRLAQLSVDRQESLLKTRVTTVAAVDQAKEDFVTSNEEVIAAAAQLDTARRELSFTELRADADGVITARTAEVGQVAKATQPIFNLAKDGPRDGIFDVQEALYLRHPPKRQLSLSLISDPGRQLQGQIREISPTIDPLKGTIRVKVNVGTDQSLPLGSSIVGRFTADGHAATEVPWSAMSFVGQIPAVWVVDPTTMIVQPREIAILRHSTQSVEVEAGLSAGELVVVEGTKFLSPGSTVVISHEP